MDNRRTLGTLAAGRFYGCHCCGGQPCINCTVALRVLQGHAWQTHVRRLTVRDGLDGDGKHVRDVRGAAGSPLLQCIRTSMERCVCVGMDMDGSVARSGAPSTSTVPVTHDNCFPPCLPPCCLPVLHATVYCCLYRKAIPGT